MANENRREFLHKAFWIFASLPVVGVALNACTKSPNPPESGGVKQSENKLPSSGPTPVPETDPVAASLGYSMNADKVDTAKWTKRAGADGAKQFCHNCQYFTAANGDWGNCQIIRNGVVNKNGWCNSWAAKPGAT